MNWNDPINPDSTKTGSKVPGEAQRPSSSRTPAIWLILLLLLIGFSMACLCSPGYILQGAEWVSSTVEISTNSFGMPPGEAGNALPVTITLPAIATYDYKPSSTPWPTEIGGIVNPSVIRLRTGPGIDYEILEEINQNEWFNLLARDGSNKWLLIQTRSGSLGWVSYFSLVNFNFNLSSLPVESIIIPTATLPGTPTTTITLTATSNITPDNSATFVPSSTTVPTGTPERTATSTRTSIPSRTSTPVKSATQKPTQTHTQAPTQFSALPTPPPGGWCDQNSVRKLCVSQVSYFIDDDGEGGSGDTYLVFDVYVENLYSFEIFIDPGKFTLKLVNGSFAYYDQAPVTHPPGETLLDYKIIAPGESAEGVLYIHISNTIPPDTLIYRGYIFEPSINILFSRSR